MLEALSIHPFEPIEEVSLKFLTLKLTFLLAITSARRVGDLLALSMKEPFLRVQPDRITLRADPLYLPKVASLFHRTQDIILPSFCSEPKNEKEKKFHLLDVRRCLLIYLERTKSFRRSNHLLVLHAGPRKGLQASKASVSRWIREAISKAYVCTGATAPIKIKAHCTRAIATSWAEKAGASWEQIRSAATWSSRHTFLKHYRVEMLSQQDLAFGRKVLQAVVPP